MSCVIINDTIREFASNFPEETTESIANVLGLWWEANPTRAEEIPSVEEMNKFITELREEPIGNELDDALISSTSRTEERDTASSKAQQLPTASLEEIRAVDFTFDPMVRRDRVSMIARHFSNEVSASLKERKDIINRRMMEESLTKEQRDQLIQELYSLDRIQIIKELTPRGVFDRVSGIFSGYLASSEEQQIQAELNAINNMEADLIEAGVIEESERFSEKEKLDAAKKKAAYKRQEYQKIIDNFRALAEEASNTLILTEGIIADPSYTIPEDAIVNGENFEEDNEDPISNNSIPKEETFKDGWMTSFRQVSSYDSLSQEVRKVIRETPRLDHEGYIEEDDLGFTRYLDAEYVHATLIDKLKDMVTSEDMIPLLDDLAKTKPWVEQIKEAIQENDSLFSKFYQDFRKDFVQYWIQKRVVMPDNTVKVETISINSPEGTYYLLDSWRDNYESGTLLDKDSIYEKNGEINKGNAAKGLKMVEELNNQFNRLSTQERLNLFEQKEVWDKIVKALNMVGINPNPSVLRVALTTIKEAPGITYTDPIILLLSDLNVIFRGTAKGDVKSEVLEDGTTKIGDLINTFGTAYNGIAQILSEVTEDAIESSVRENGNSYYSHVNPSYLGKLVKQLRNAMNRSKEEYDKFIETEFKQYEWFFKDGRWRNDWIRELAENPSMRKALQHKVLLNYDKREYEKWDDLDYTLVLLNEYLAEPKEKMAWYAVPILSDAPSAEFIRFKRFTDFSEMDEDGNRLTFQESIVNRMVDLVNQEYDRIMLVRERNEKFLNKDPNISPITNFDISYNDKGELESLGGAEFKFLPRLNTYTYENGEAFLDRFERLREGSPSEFKKFLKDTIIDIIEEDFEEAYQDWAKMGLLDELPNGKLKHISYQGQSHQNKIVATAMRQAKDILGNLFTSEMESLLNEYTENKPINDKQATKIFDQIKALLEDRAFKGEFNEGILRNINKNLTTKNTFKSLLREYHWNSTFATSQIIQLTTTDLAYYKNYEDFQKRFKEVHAPSRRLNTLAKFKGEAIGRTFEKTIYLADDEIVSSTIADLEEIFNEKVKNKELTEIEKDYIISQYRNINVADAQAYRSLSSYRAMMGMMGQWTDEMETAYKHLTDPNGKWTMRDFTIIWQTKKPYVYTQVDNFTGVYEKKEESYIDENGQQTRLVDDLSKPIHSKTPVQHKNSEFLLLALHDAIAGPLGKSGKLKAINEFMEKNQIDVVQFESTTKVGKQGTIDINSATDYESTMKILREATGIAHGQENPNVVHKISYEDYGIQVETPEHGIDAAQLIGTQIRRLATADIPDSTRLTIGDKTMSKAEWLKTYNSVIVENLLQSFQEVYEIFKDPKKIEAALQKEIRKSPRYGMDLQRACTLNEDGEFNIPLYDPVQSLRAQALLSSIVKNTITKQKIRGGALIQVSSYGVTDQLKIVYEGKGEHKRVKYLECYMPAYSREFYEPLMGEDGLLDVNKLPDNLRKLIGYRVPTENKYSMVPLYIKGFLPQQNGSAIMLPAEITTISGSDFDERSTLK